MGISVAFKRYILPFLIAFFLTFILSGLLCLMFSLFNPPFAVNDFINRYMYCICTAISAFFAARLSGRNGLITGIVSGNISTLLLILFGMIILKNSFPYEALLKLVILSSVFGGIFGVVGLNFKK